MVDEIEIFILVDKLYIILIFKNFHYLVKMNNMVSFRVFAVIINCYGTGINAEKLFEIGFRLRYLSFPNIIRYKYITAILESIQFVL